MTVPCGPDCVSRSEAINLSRAGPQGQGLVGGASRVGLWISQYIIISMKVHLLMYREIIV